MEIKKYDNIEALEFEMLEEIKVTDNEINTNLFEQICNLNSLNIGIVIGFIKNQTIIRSSADYINLMNKIYEEGDILLYDNEGKTIFKIDKNIFERTFLENLIKKRDENYLPYGNKTITLENFKGALNKDYLKKELDRMIKKEKDSQEERGREKEEREKELEEKEINKEKSFKEDSIGEFSFGKTNKNTITTYSSKFIPQKNINEIFGFDDLDRMRGWQDKMISGIEHDLIEKELNYLHQIKDSNDKWVDLYKVKFKNKFMCVNGIAIPFNKRGFILSRMRLDTPKEIIGLMCKLTGMKIQMLDLKTISLYDRNKNIEVDIKVKLIDINNFRVEFMNKSKDLEWDFLKRIFFSGRDICSSLSNEKFKELSSNFGYTKLEMFQHLKRIVMLENLK